MILGSMRFFVLTVLFSFHSQLALSADRGAALFELCAACHGPAAAGNADIEAPAIAGLPVWYLEAQLKKYQKGVRGLHPKHQPGMRMRPMARSLQTDADVKAVAEFVSKLPIQITSDTVKGRPVAGEKQYQVCTACHGPEAKGNQALNAPPLTGASDWYLLTQLRNFKNGIRGADAQNDPNGAAMAGIAKLLDEQAMADVVAYINLLKTKD